MRERIPYYFETMDQDNHGTTSPGKISLRDHIILCGLGRIGSRVLESLGSRNIAVISPSFGNQMKRLPELDHVMLLEADARDEEALERAGIKRAKALIAATDSDEINLQVALTAAELNPELPVVIRIFGHSFAKKISAALPKCQAISTSSIASEHFAAAAFSDNILAIINIEDTPLFICRDCPDPEKQHGVPEMPFAGNIPLSFSYLADFRDNCPCFASSPPRKIERTAGRSAYGTKCRYH